MPNSRYSPQRAARREAHFSRARIRGPRLNKGHSARFLCFASSISAIKVGPRVADETLEALVSLLSGELVVHSRRLAVLSA